MFNTLSFPRKYLQMIFCKSYRRVETVTKFMNHFVSLVEHFSQIDWVIATWYIATAILFVDFWLVRLRSCGRWAENIDRKARIINTWLRINGGVKCEKLGRMSKMESHASWWRCSDSNDVRTMHPWLIGTNWIPHDTSSDGYYIYLYIL